MSLIGKINTYTCSQGHQIITIDRDEGVTPMFINCPFCEKEGKENISTSCMYSCPQDWVPTHEWYKPQHEEIAMLREDFKDHIERGGLLFREIKKESK